MEWKREDGKSVGGDGDRCLSIGILRAESLR